MDLSFTDKAMRLCIVVFPNEHETMLGWLECLVNNTDSEELLIDYIKEFFSLNSDTNKPIVVKIDGKFIDLSVRLMNEWVDGQKEQGLDFTETEKLLLRMKRVQSGESVN